MKVCAVIPAYNEAGRISKVLDALAEAPSIAQVVVVDDGSHDGTGDVARAHPLTHFGTLTVLTHSPNRGKGAAMQTGADYTDADVLVFFDADLIGLTPHHIESLVAPVVSGQAAMALGVFRGGRGATTLAQIIAPNISGQRAIRRDVFLSIPCVASSGFGVELAITGFVEEAGLPLVQVVLKDVTHPMKEEKLGPLKGIQSRVKMYWQMMPYIVRRLLRPLLSRRRR